MPKVSAEYITNKKNSILEAALSVCRNKPLYEITMKDIIKESGVSQGGIYRYFSDLDDILIALINISNTNIDFKQNIDEIIENSTTPKDVIESLFAFLGRNIKENLTTIGKFQFELTVLLSNHPDRKEKIMSQITEVENSQYLMNQLFDNINNGIASGDFIPIVHIKDIFYFIITSIDGIIRDAVLFKCYGPNKNTQLEIEEISLMHTLSKSVLLMLSCNK